MFAVNIDIPTKVARIHVWPDGTPRFSVCEERHKNPANGGWERFIDDQVALEFARQSGLCVCLCKRCKPTIRL